MASREWSLGGGEPFWRTNSSFSPPLSGGWERALNPRGLSYGSQDDSAIALYTSSISSGSSDSQNWIRDELALDHHNSLSVGGASHFSSPTNSFQDQQLTPLGTEGVHSGNPVFATSHQTDPPAFSRIAEGTSGISNSIGFNYSLSDGSDSEFMSQTNSHSYTNFAGCYSFMLKHFPTRSFDDEEEPESAALLNTHKTYPYNLKSVSPLDETPYLPGSFTVGTSNIEAPRQSSSSSSSIECIDYIEPLEFESSGRLLNQSQGPKCGFCEKYMSQRSPWCSSWIVRSGDLPTAGILPCQHVYHAECLEQTNPVSEKHDPTCPLCVRMEDSIPERLADCRSKSGLHRLKVFADEGPSRSWSCGRVGDCVEGALYVSPQNAPISKKKHLKRHLSLKSESSDNEQTEKPNISGLCPTGRLIVQNVTDGIGCPTKRESNPAFKRCSKVFKD